MSPQQQSLLMISLLKQHTNGVALEVAAMRHIGRPNEEAPISRILPEDPLLCEKVMSWLRHENTQIEANIWIRPIPAAHHPWLLLDDLSLDLAFKIAKKYASLLIETSPSNFQCRLLCCKPMDVRLRGHVQSTLIRLLNAHGDYADPGSTAGNKWGRLAGFRNRKPGRDCWTNLMLDTTTTSLKFDPMPYLSPRGGECASSVLEQKRPPVSSSTLTSAVSDSEREFGWALNRLRFFQQKGLDVAAEADIIRIRLIEKASQRDKRNPEDYARRTIAAALRAMG